MLEITIPKRYRRTPLRYRLNPMAAAVALMSCTTVAAIAQDEYNPSVVTYGNHSWSDGSYRYTQGNHIVVTGVVIRVNEETGRLAVRSDGQRRYNVDTYNAE